MRAIFKPLTGSRVVLRPGTPADLEPLFEIGNDPEVWAIHRHKNRGDRKQFTSFFLSGLSNPLGVYTICEKYSGTIMGTTRYYRFEREEPGVHIGYTFLAKKYWGTGINAEVKALMLQNAFRMVNTVYFDVFVDNIRSHKAVMKLGAQLFYINGDRYLYRLPKILWQRQSSRPVIRYSW